MGLKYVEDPGDWFSCTLKDGVRQQCCGCGSRTTFTSDATDADLKCGLSATNNGGGAPRAQENRRHRRCVIARANASGL
jgi:hypothetical protein